MQPKLSESIPSATAPRLSAIPHRTLLREAQAALETFARTTENTPPQAEIIGIAIVGSTITETFEPETSDLDLYYLASEKLTSDVDGFTRLMNDDTYPRSPRDADYIPDIYSEADVLGVISVDCLGTTLREPYAAFATEIPGMLAPA